MLCSPSVFQNLVHSDQAYKFLQTVCGTPTYWQKMLFESLAMLKALGTPTFFMTVSAADYHWPEIIQAIGLEKGRCFTGEDVLNISCEHKSEWLDSNPVTAVQQFQHHFSSLHQFIMSKARPLGIVTGFIEKVQFQACGSPHYHVNYWVRNTPTLDGIPMKLYVDSSMNILQLLYPKMMKTSAHLSRCFRIISVQHIVAERWQMPLWLSKSTITANSHFPSTIRRYTKSQGTGKNSKGSTQAVK